MLGMICSEKTTDAKALSNGGECPLVLSPQNLIFQSYNDTFQNNLRVLNSFLYFPQYLIVLLGNFGVFTYITEIN